MKSQPPDVPYSCTVQVTLDGVHYTVDDLTDEEREHMLLMQKSEHDEDDEDEKGPAEPRRRRPKPAAPAPKGSDKDEDEDDLAAMDPLADANGMVKVRWLP
jgi:hypothetical protein